MQNGNVYRDFTRDLGFKLRLIRDFLGYNMDEMAKKFGISNGLVKSYESGRENPNLLYIYEVTKACGIAIEDLFEEKTDFVKKLYF